MLQKDLPERLSMSAGAKKKRTRVFLGKDRRVWRNISSYCARQKYKQLINNSIKFYQRHWLCERNSAFKIPIIYRSLGSENSSPVVQTQAAVTEVNYNTFPYIKQNTQFLQAQNLSKSNSVECMCSHPHKWSLFFLYFVKTQKNRFST